MPTKIAIQKGIGKIVERLHEVGAITRLIEKNKQFVVKKYDCNAKRIDKFNSSLPFVLSYTQQHIAFNNFQLEIPEVPAANLWRAWLKDYGRDDYYCEAAPDALFLSIVGDDLSYVLTISQWFQFHLSEAERSGAITLLGSAINQMYTKLKYKFQADEDMDKIFNAIGVIPGKAQFFLIDPAIPLESIPNNSPSPTDLSAELYERVIDYLSSMMLSG